MKFNLLFYKVGFMEYVFFEMFRKFYRKLWLNKFEKCIFVFVVLFFWRNEIKFLLGIV